MDYTKQNNYYDLIIKSNDNILLYFSKFLFCSKLPEYFTCLYNFNNGYKDIVNKELKSEIKKQDNEIVTICIDQPAFIINYVLNYFTNNLNKTIIFNNEYILDLFIYACEINNKDFINSCYNLLIINFEAIFNDNDNDNIINIYLILFAHNFIQEDDNYLFTMFYNNIEKILENPEFSKINPELLGLIISNIGFKDKMKSFLTSWCNKNNTETINKLKFNYSKITYDDIINLYSILQNYSIGDHLTKNIVNLLTLLKNQKKIVN